MGYRQKIDMMRDYRAVAEAVYRFDQLQAAMIKVGNQGDCLERMSRPFENWVSWATEQITEGKETDERK